MWRQKNNEKNKLVFFVVYSSYSYVFRVEQRSTYGCGIYSLFYSFDSFCFLFFMWLLLSWLISIEIMQILLVPSSLPISSSTWVFVCVCMCVYSVAIKTYVACGFPVFLCRFFLSSSSASSSSALSPFGVCAFSGSVSVVRRTSCSTGSCCCCCWPPLLSRLDCSLLPTCHRHLSFPFSLRPPSSPRLPSLLYLVSYLNAIANAY